MTDVLNGLTKISTPPSEQAAFDAWLELRDAIEFLKANDHHAEFVVYAGISHTFIQAIIVPSSAISPANVDDLKEWDSNASSSWGITTIYSNPPSVFYIVTPRAYEKQHFEGRRTVGFRALLRRPSR
jgi:hypothetical protein